MRAFSSLSTPFPVRLPSRRFVVAVLIGLGVAAVILTWRESLLVPAAVSVLGAAAAILVRRSWRRASAQLDTILHEELDTPTHERDRA